MPAPPGGGNRLSVADLAAAYPVPLTETPDPIPDDPEVADRPPLCGWRRWLAEYHYRRKLPHACVTRKFAGLARHYNDDMIQVAALGLCEAMRRWSPRYRDDRGRPVKSATFAWRYMWGYLMRAFVRPIRQREKYGITVTELHCGDHGRSEDTIEEMLYAQCKRNLLGDFDAVDAYQDSRRHVGKLHPRDAEMLIDRFRGDTNEEIGRRHGVSRERVRQILEQVKDRLGIEALPGQHCERDNGVDSVA